MGGPRDPGSRSPPLHPTGLNSLTRPWTCFLECHAITLLFCSQEVDTSFNRLFWDVTRQTKNQKGNRCLEVNGFGGVNFLKSPCIYLDMNKTMDNERDKSIDNIIIDEQQTEKKPNKLLSIFELSIVRCWVVLGGKRRDDHECYKRKFMLWIR